MNVQGLPTLTDPGARVRAELAATVTRVSPRANVIARLADACSWEECPDGSLAGTWSATVGGWTRRLDGALVLALLVNLALLGSDDVRPGPVEAEALAADVAVEVRARIARAARAVPREVPTLSLARAVAGRLARRRETWLAADGRVLWRDPVADPAGHPVAGAVMPVPPISDRAAGSLADRTPHREVVEVTASVVADELRTSGLVQAHEARPDPGAVLDELRTVAARRPVPEDISGRSRWRRSATTP